MKNENPYTSMIYSDYKKTYENPLLLFGSRLIFSDKTPFGAITLIKLDSKGVNYYLRNISRLQENDYVEITYENLCKNPNKTINKILDLLEIKTKKVDFSNYIKPRKTTLDKNVKSLHGYIYKNMKNYFEKFDYNPDL